MACRENKNGPHDWARRAEEILQEGRRKYRDESERWEVGQAGAEGVRAAINAQHWWVASKANGKVVKAQRVNRGLCASMMALFSSLCSQKNLSQLNQAWINAESSEDKVRAVVGYVSNALASAGLGWLSEPCLLLTEELIERAGECMNPNCSMTKDQTLRWVCKKGVLGGFVVSIAVDFMLYLAGCNDKDPFCLENGVERGAMSALSGLVNFISVKVGAAGWLHFVMSFLVIWAIGQIFKNIQQVGWNYYLKSWLPAYMVGTPEWDYNPNVLNVPHDLCCPLSFEPFIDPVWCLDQLYERKMIEDWIIQHGTHPIARGTQVSLASLKKRSCPKMKSLVEEYMAANGIDKVRKLQPGMWTFN